MMEDVDGIILDCLRSLECDDVEDIAALSELKTAGLITAVVMCLNKILDENGSTKLPPGVTGKYQFCTVLADKIKTLGYRGDLGYQTLLYGSEQDVRNLLIFLVEALPKDSAHEIVTDMGMGPISKAKKTAGAKLLAQLQRPYRPPFLTRKRFNGKEFIPFRSHAPLEFYKGKFSDQRTMPLEDIPASIIEHLILTDPDFSSDIKYEAYEAVDVELLKTALVNKPKVAAKPKLLPKPKNVNKSLPASDSKLDATATASHTSVTEDSKLEVHDEPSEAEAKEVRELEAKLASLQTHCTQLRQEILQLKADYTQVDLSSIRITSESMRTDLAKKNKLVSLLPNGKDSISKLEGLVERLHQKMETLEQTFVHEKSEALAQIAKFSSESAYERVLEETEQLEKKWNGLSNEHAEKDQLLSKLRIDSANINKAVGRNVYTRRIMEIMANIRKQREEIEKILGDIREIQRSINLLDGRLDRTFTAIDEQLFTKAQQSESARRAYKMVVALHQECAEVRGLIEKTASKVKETQDIEEKVATANHEELAKNLEKLTGDYSALKTENDTIEKSNKE